MPIIKYKKEFRGGTIAWTACVTDGEWDLIKGGISVYVAEQFGKWDERDIEINEKCCSVLSSDENDMAVFNKLFPEGYHGNIDIIGLFINKYQDETEDQWTTGASLETWMLLKQLSDKWEPVERAVAKMAELQKHNIEHPAYSELVERKKQLLRESREKFSRRKDLERIAAALIDCRKGSGSLHAARWLWEDLSSAIGIRWKGLPYSDNTLKKLVSVIADKKGIFTKNLSKDSNDQEIQQIINRIRSHQENQKLLIEKRLAEEKAEAEQIEKDRIAKEKENRAASLAKQEKLKIQRDWYQFIYDWQQATWSTEHDQDLLEKLGNVNHLRQGEHPPTQQHYQLLEELKLRHKQRTDKEHTWSSPEGEEVILTPGMTVQIGQSEYTIREMRPQRKVMVTAPTERKICLIAEIEKVIQKNRINMLDADHKML